MHYNAGKKKYYIKLITAQIQEGTAGLYGISAK